MIHHDGEHGNKTSAGQVERVVPGTWDGAVLMLRSPGVEAFGTESTCSAFI